MAARRAILILGVVLCAGNAYAADATAICTAAVGNAAQRQDCVAARLGPTGGFQAGFVTDLLQVLGEIVVERATDAAWGALRDEVMDLLQCKKPTMYFPDVCGVLANARLQDVVSSPLSLLQAAESDLLKMALDKLAVSVPNVKSALTVLDMFWGAFAEARTSWKDNGPSAFSAALGRRIRGQIYQAAASQTCPSAGTPVEAYQAIWMIGECFIHYPGSDAATALDACDANLPTCATGNYTDRLRLYTYLRDSITQRKAQGKARAAINFVFETAKLAYLALPAPPPRTTKDTEYRIIGALQATILGIIDLDWVRVTTNGITVLELINDQLGPNSIPVPKRLMQILAAVGQYAATYNPDSVTDAQQARKSVLEAFIKSQVNRTDRHGGAVFSLGGSFGLGGTYRRSFDGKTTGGTGPLLLPLGVGMQTYRDCRECFQVGLHMELGIVDLGQYVSFEGGQPNVGTPNGGDVLAPSLTLGVWFWKREVPFFVAAHGGMAPFVRSDGNPTWFVGGMVGAYVPFFDFN